MRREGVRQAQSRGELPAVGARAEDKERHVEPRPGHRLDLLARLGVFEIMLQFHHVARERVRVGEVAAHGTGRDPVRARRAAEPEVDAAGIQRRQRAELFGDGQGRVVGQHDAARADADGRRPFRHVARHHRGRRRCDARHVVVFGEPVSVIAPALRVLGEVTRVAKGLARVRAVRHGAKVEDREGDHGGSAGMRRPGRSDSRWDGGGRGTTVPESPRARGGGRRSRLGAEVVRV